MLSGPLTSCKQEGLKIASAGDLNAILALIKDKSFHIVLREIFKFFPNFDDGTIGKRVFTLAEGDAVAEENIKIDML